LRVVERQVAKDFDVANKLMTVYDFLYRQFGPQHWWPADSPFEVSVGAILTQQVSWNNVERAISNLKHAGLLDPFKIQAISLGSLEELIKPTGFYRVKARRLKAFVNFLCSRFEGSMESMFQIPGQDLRTMLLSVFGIGPETADSILLYAGGVPVFVVDAYTMRLIDRLGIVVGYESKPSYDRVQSLFHDNLPRDAYLYNEYHALIVALCKDKCKAGNPCCKDCCLLDICSSYRHTG
jgi:endonuclease-3 related protein